MATGPTRVKYVDGKIQYGRGRAANVLGQTYTVYRLGPKSNGSILNGKPVYNKFQMRGEKSSKKALENATFDLLAFTFEVDNLKLERGDILVETGYKSDNGIWMFAQDRPTRESVFMRVETKCFISRPNTGAGSSAQQVAGSGVVVSRAWGATYKGIEEYLTLAGGVYTFKSPPDATMGATIPIGIQPLNRVRDGTIPKVPTKQYRTHHLVFVPLVIGEQLNEQDRINAATGDRYEIMEVHSTVEVGLSGYICIVEKLAT